MIALDEPQVGLAASLAVVISDVAFFAGIAFAIALAYALRPSRRIARGALLTVAFVLAWSAANAVWLRMTGVQLQVGIIQVLMKHPAEFWPTVQPYVARPSGVLVLGAVAAMAVWVAWRLVSPAAVLPLRAHPRRRAILLAVVLALTAPLHFLRPSRYDPSILSQTLGFSSHAHALWSTLAFGWQGGSPARAARGLPRAGELVVGLPETDPAELPNIVIVMLESTSYHASALGDESRDVMPNVARIASAGVEFVNTHAPVSQTGKAVWAVFTGTAPDLEPDFVEAVLADEVYEGLPSLLRRIGYRSAFFKMAKGTFQCAPATLANLGFDWAWFRENLQDPSAHLGYLAGDDFRMIDPAFDWAARQDGPYMFVLLTSVAHDPHEVPAWFGAVKADRHERFVQCMRFTDAFVGAVDRRLTELGLIENTLLCVLGDHGESFRRGARRGRWVPYEEVIRVPWLIRWPARLKPGTRLEWPCSQLDVTPTILSLLGYDLPQGGFAGRNAMLPADAARRLYFSAWFDGSPSGFIENGRKIVYWPHNGELFASDLAADTSELSPARVSGIERDRSVADILSWRRESRIAFAPRRFRKRFLYDHWWTFSSGRYARAYYVPGLATK